MIAERAVQSGFHKSDTDGGIDFVMSETGELLAGPMDLRTVVAALDIGALASSELPRVMRLDGHLAHVRRVKDPDRPWYLVRLTPLTGKQSAVDRLTPRQLEVARLAAMGRRSHEIGEVVGCSTNTVRSHLRVIYERLAVSNRIELLRALGEE